MSKYSRPSTLVATTTTLLLTVMLVSVMLLSGVEQARAQFVRKPGAKLRLCYFYGGKLTDLGYTFSFHIGRLQAQEELKALYPDIQIESVYEENVFFGSPNRTQLLLDYVASGCHMIITNANQALFSGKFGGPLVSFHDWAATTFPNVSFVIGGDSNNPLKWTHPNMIWVSNDLIGAFFRAGVAAAHEAPNCIGVIAAFEKVIGANINGFIKGVRSVKPTLPIHVIESGAFFNPPGELKITDLFLERGCNIMARHTNSRDVDVKLSNLKSLKGEKYFSVGIHSNLQEYVGDTVLTAIFNNWVRVIVPWVRDVVEKGTVQQQPVAKFYGLPGDYVRTAPISPLAKPSTIAAVDALGVVNEHNVFCGEVKLRDGRVWTPATPGGCMTIAERRTFITSFLDDPNVVYHNKWVSETTCPPGSSYSFTSSGPIVLTCTVCPANTYSTEAGSPTCTPCDEGEESPSNSSKCTLIIPPAEKEFPYWIISIIVVVVVFLCVGIAYVVQKSAKVAGAPKDASKPFGAMFIGPKNISQLWQRVPDDVPVAQEEFTAIVRRACKKTGCYECRHVGSFFLLVSVDPAKLVRCAEDIQQQVLAFKWSTVFQRSNTDASTHKGSHKKGAPRRKRLQRKSSNMSSRQSQSEVSSTDRGSRASSSKDVVALSNLKLEVGAGIQYGTGRIQYDKEQHSYDYSGAVVDDAAHVIDVAQRGQVLVVEAAVNMIEEDNSTVGGSFAEFTAKKLNGCNLKCQLMQFNSSARPTMTFAEPKDEDENVDSVMNALQESKGGLTQKRITVLCVNVVHFAAKNSTLPRDTATRKYKDVCEVIEGNADANRGVVHHAADGQFIITFNAAFPTAGHTYRAGFCAAQIQNELADLEVGPVLCGFDSGVAMCGPMPGFASGRKDDATVTHQAINGTVVQNAVLLANLCAQYDDPNIFCLATTKKIGDLNATLFTQHIDVIPHIDTVFDQHANPAKPFTGIVAVYGAKTSDEADCDEWLYELQNQASGDPFAKVNACFEAVLEGDIEKARTLRDAENDDAKSQRGMQRVSKILDSASLQDYTNASPATAFIDTASNHKNKGEKKSSAKTA